MTSLDHLVRATLTIPFVAGGLLLAAPVNAQDIVDENDLVLVIGQSVTGNVLQTGVKGAWMTESTVAGSFTEQGEGEVWIERSNIGGVMEDGEGDVWIDDTVVRGNVTEAGGGDLLLCGSTVVEGNVEKVQVADGECIIFNTVNVQGTISPNCVRVDEPCAGAL